MQFGESAYITLRFSIGTVAMLYAYRKLMIAVIAVMVSCDDRMWKQMNCAQICEVLFCCAHTVTTLLAWAESDVELAASMDV